MKALVQRIDIYLSHLSVIFLIDSFIVEVLTFMLSLIPLPMLLSSCILNITHYTLSTNFCIKLCIYQIGSLVLFQNLEDQVHLAQLFGLCSMG